MACMTCVECGESHNESVCPACGSTLNVWDESESDNEWTVDDESLSSEEEKFED